MRKDFCTSMRALTNATLRKAPSGMTHGTTSPTDGVSTMTGSLPPERSSILRRRPRIADDDICVMENDERS